MENRIFSVTELTRKIKGVLESGFKDVSVKGEISNFKRHSSGHFYFTLKDEGAQLSAVMWKGRTLNLFFTPQDGMKVIARGNITLYEVRGQYQIDVVQLQPLGVGELQLAFEQLKRKLAEEGLFDDEHKVPIPEYPERIGIVTSPTGAAIRDMINVISRRFPAVELILYPVNVQGSGAAEEIADAIRDFNEWGNVDVLIVGRGGGSLEDLWAFNEEIVARTVYDSEIPVISAVGHEIDFTIADFVADFRAPTPSAAAELVVKSRFELFEIVRNFHYTIRQRVQELLATERDKIRYLVSSYAFNMPHDAIRQFSQRVDELDRALNRIIGHQFTLNSNNLQSLQKRIHSLHPDTVLKRGYTMIKKNGSVIGSALKLLANDDVQIKFHDGEVPAKIK
jgi:exodeoxyribonuclease VII large subunit